MWLTIAAILVILWLLGFVAFHVASGLIHILLLIAVIAIIVHFVRGRGPA
ncbi:MAG TPA: lmo0937 family membrane protein [Sphingomonadaceae bacterium]